MLWLRGFVIWLVFIVAESMNGTIRILWLIPSLGEMRSHQISFLTGSILILGIATLLIRWLNTSSVSQLIQVGVLWVFLTILFEICLGRFVLGYSWGQIAADYNIQKGGLMPFGLLLLILSPLIAGKLRGVIEG